MVVKMTDGKVSDERDFGALLGNMVNHEWPTLVGERPIALYMRLCRCSLPEVRAILVVAAVRQLLKTSVSQHFRAGKVGHVGVHLWEAEIPVPAVLVMVADDGDCNINQNDYYNVPADAIDFLVAEASGELRIEQAREQGTIHWIILPRCPPHTAVLPAAATTCKHSMMHL